MRTAWSISATTRPLILLSLRRPGSCTAYTNGKSSRDPHRVERVDKVAPFQPLYMFSFCTNCASNDFRAKGWKRTHFLHPLHPAQARGGAAMNMTFADPAARVDRCDIAPTPECGISLHTVQLE